jgi:hypothetical protein
MAGRNVPLVMIPRFTAYVGTGTYDLLPIPASAYDRLVINVWRGPMLGTTPTLSVFFQESNDGDTWVDTTGTAGGPVPLNVETQFTEALTKAWLRLRVVLAGTNPAGMCYAIGFLERRER